MPSKKKTSLLVPVLLASAAILWAMASKAATRPTAGKDWRAGSGTVRLLAAVVYRMDLVAPLSADPQLDPTSPGVQNALVAAIEALGAKDISFQEQPDGVHALFNQSYPESRTITFGESRIGPFVARSARRLDGLSWEAP